MQVNEFRNKVQMELQEQFPEYEFEQKEVVKNHVTKVGIMIHTIGQLNEMCPVVYVDSWNEEMEEGKSFSTCMEEIEDVVRGALSSIHKIDLGSILENWRARAKYFLVDASDNDYLAGKPWTPVLDMAKVYALRAYDLPHGVKGSLIINDNTIEALGVSLEELDEVCTSNTQRILPVTMRWIQDIMLEKLEAIFMEEEIDESLKSVLRAGCQAHGEIPMLVLSNEMEWDGAAVMLYEGVLDMACEQLGEEQIYILPSSRHEVIVVPATEDANRLYEIVRDINSTKVLPEDLLTTQVYAYEMGGELTFADLQQEEEMEMTM